MNLGTILVHLDHTERSAVRVALAARLARAHGSHLVGLVPTGLFEGVVPMGSFPVGAADFLADSADFLRRRAESVARDFRALISEPAGLSYTLRQVDGSPVDAVIRHGRASDLVVLGQDDPEAEPGSVTHDLAEEVLPHLGRPILVVPYAGRFENVGQRVLLAWDGSREAAVALRDALPLLGKAERVTLASFRHPGEDVRGSGPEIDAVCQWLLRHGVQAAPEDDVTDIAFADALLSRVSDLGVDLVVMGGYGHARLREFVLGGVTREILAQMTVPVLISH